MIANNVKKDEKDNNKAKLEEAFSELNKCDSNNKIDYVIKFEKYFQILKKVVPGIEKGYDLRII